MGSPKELTKAEVSKLNDLTQDISETDQAIESTSDGTVEVSIPMKSNDIVLIKLERRQGGQLSQAGRDKASR
jgi:xylan 1,4-beta-xylosidase